MAVYLYRLGGWCFTHRWKVLGAWVFILVAVGASAVAFKGQTSNEFSVPGTESERAQQLLEKKFPGAGGAAARMVFAAPEGHKLTEPKYRAAVDESLARAKHSSEVISVVDPFTANALTKDGRVGFADVIYPVQSDQIEDEARDELAATAEPARDAGLQVEFGGGVVRTEGAASSESIGMMVAFVVLAITLGSLLAAGLPLITALIGVALGSLGLTALTDVFTISETAPILATMLGLAVGIDYALFILSRHRQNVAEGMENREAAAQATASTGSAVVFAGLTVIIALVGLLVVNIPFLTVMGLAAAATVAIAVLIALTLLPAIFGFAGHRLARFNRVLTYRPRRRAVARETAGVRWAKLVTRRPWAVLVVGLALLGAAAIPALHMELGLPDDGSKPGSTTERRGYDLLTDGFGPGFNGPPTIVVDAPNRSSADEKAIAVGVADGLEELPGVAAVSKPIQNANGDVTIVSVTPTSGPSSEQTKDLVTVIRDKAEQIDERTGIRGYVTGQTAVNIDTADQLSAALPKYVAVVVGLALLLLMVVFRSILVPLKAAAGFLLSIAASMGIVVWIFQDGHLAGLFDVSNPGPVVSFLPILLIGILFGLAMDYEVFLVSRMRELYVHTGRARESVVTGYGHSARVVTAAA